eukprot:354549_1
MFSEHRHLLVDGYIRENEQLIHPKVIPKCINIIIFNLYNDQFVLFFVKSKKTGFNMHAIDINNKESWKFRIYDMNKPSKLYDPSLRGYTTMIHSNNFSIPLSINTKMTTACMDTKISFTFNPNRNYSILFRCGGYNYNNGAVLDECNAIIFDQSQIHHTNKNAIDGFAWRLPALPNQGYGTSIVYSDEYGLICTGNSQCIADIYNLKFEDDIDTNNNWKWERFATMKAGRCYTQTVIINKNMLMVAAGEISRKGSNNCVELMDLKTKNWQKVAPCLQARYYGGIVYDNKLQRVYLGGGINADQHVEYYDIVKNDWYKLSNTNMLHDTNPLLWCVDKTVYIGSVKSHGIECMDLRENQSKWKVVYNERTFTDAFDIKSTDENNFRKWLVCS